MLHKDILSSVEYGGGRGGEGGGEVEEDDCTCFMGVFTNKLTRVIIYFYRWGIWPRVDIQCSNILPTCLSGISCSKHEIECIRADSESCRMGC